VQVDGVKEDAEERLLAAEAARQDMARDLLLLLLYYLLTG